MNLNAKLCNMKAIPKEITSLAPEGATIEYLGKYVGMDAYHAYIPDAVTGFPFVYVVNGKHIKEITGFDALEIINEFIKEE